MGNDIKADNLYKLLMNPTRMRIVQALERMKELTTFQLAEELPDVAVATLYRQVKALESGGLLCIIKENRIRGTIEKVYALKKSPINDDLTISQVQQLIDGTLLSLMGTFHNYFDTGDINPEKDGYFVGTSTLMLSDDEMSAFIKTISTTLGELLNNKPDGERKARRITYISSPCEED